MIICKTSKPKLMANPKSAVLIMGFFFFKKGIKSPTGINKNQFTKKSLAVVFANFETLILNLSKRLILEKKYRDSTTGITILHFSVITQTRQNI